MLVVQKYRLYLSRLQKESDLKASFGGFKHSDLPLKDPAGSFGLQSSINTNQDDGAKGRYQFSGNNLFGQAVDIKNHEGDLKGIVSEPRPDNKTSLTPDVPDPQETSSTQMSFDHSFALGSEVKYAAFDCSIPAQYSWSETPEINFKQENKPVLQLEDGFSQLPPHAPQHHIQIDPLHSVQSITSGLSLTGRNTSGAIKVEPLYAEYKSAHVSHASPKESAIDMLPVQSKSHIIDNHSFEANSTAISSMKPQGFSLSCITDFESCHRNLISASDSTFAPFNEELTVCWLPGDFHSKNFGLPNFTDYNDPGFISEIPAHLYDALTADYECPFDQTEYTLVDQGLFIA